MEFELDDYRTGRINKKVKNLNCINSTGYNNNYNYNKKKIEKIEKEKIKTINNNKNNVNNNPKAIYVNSKNNNYLITKLKKENESLRLILLEYESDIIKYKINEKKFKQKKIENPTVRITRKSTNVKPSQQIMKGLNNISNYANNTFTTNFYHPKNNNKFNSNNNSLLTNNNKINETQNNSNSKIALMNSYIVHNKKIVNNNSKKSLSVFRSSSKNKSKKQSNKNIYDKIKTNYKKINNGYDNVMEIKNKDKKQESYNNINNNTRINTLNNNINTNNYISSKNVFTYKKKVNQNSESTIQNNICNTERKQEANITSSNTNTENNKDISNQINFNRNTVFIPKQEFNLTWSRFSKKDMETSFENYIAQKSPPQSVIMSSKNIKKIENRNNKYITNAGSKNKYSVDKFDNYNLRRKPDITPQKITINRRIITNKMKNNKNCFSSNNVSMKNIINIRQKNQRNGFEENKHLNKNVINTSASNKMMNINNLSNDGEIYTHKKKNSMIVSKNIVDKTDEEILKKNSYNNKYNVTINNINNCNYYNLIQGDNKPEIKIIKKRINKNN